MIHPVDLPDHLGRDHPLLHPGVGELEADAVELGVVPVGVHEELLPVSQRHLGVQLSCRVHHLKHIFPFSNLIRNDQPQLFVFHQQDFVRQICQTKSQVPGKMHL